MLVQPLEITQTFFENTELLRTPRSFGTRLFAFCHHSTDLFVFELEHHIRAEHSGEFLEEALLDGEISNVVYERLLGNL